MQPVVIHIGYPKAGSTFLQQYFSAHPQITYSGNMLVNYKRTGEILVQLPENDINKTIVISEEQLSVWQGKLDIVGVKFLDYDIEQHQKTVAEKLHTLYPAAKILIVPRGFAAALQSTYSQYISIGGILNFNNFQQQFGSIFARFYNYNYLIPVYKQLFGDENVLILPFEWLKENPEAFTRYMEQQLAFTPLPVTTTIYNQSLQAGQLNSYLQLSNKLYRLIKPLPKGAQQLIYGTYVYWLYQRKLNWLAGKAGLPDPLVLQDNTLQLFRGNATVFKNEQLFQPYLKEYLL